MIKTFRSMREGIGQGRESSEAEVRTGSIPKASSWRLEGKEDIEKYLAALRIAMESELETIDIVNVEF